MQIDVQLINETQYGSRLNHAIESNRRGEFGLLLAMLSADVRDMAQFQLDADKTTPEKLAKQFQLPEPQALVDQIGSDTAPINHAEAFTQDGCRGFQLMQALKPEALVVRGQHSLAMTEVLSNCDVVTRLKHEGNVNTPNVVLEHFVDQLTNQRQFEIAV